MKLKKGILLTALTFITISSIGLFSSIQAATANTPKTLNIKALRNSGYGYQVVNNSTKFIWKIYDVNRDINETFYCIKGGPGFGSSDMGGTTIKETDYTEYFDMKDPDSITSKYLNAIPDPKSKDYERLMWVLDQCYVQPKTNASSSDREKAAEYKKALLDAVETYAAKYPGVYENTSNIHDKLTDNLTEDDIDAIQQLAVWHYTNDDDYHVANNPSIKINSIKGTDGNYKELDINDDEDAARIHAMDALFDYLTKTPKESGFSYDYKKQNSSKPAQIAKNNITFETSGDRIIVGPYKIEELRNIQYSLTGTFTDGNNKEIKDIKFLNNNKEEVSKETTLKDLVGSNFYISIPSTTNTSNIKFTINGNFWTTEIIYWSVENPSSVDQPVVQIEKINKPFSDYIEVQKETPKEFDLALRKFITKINNVSLEGTNSRVPTISNTELNNLANGNKTTAEKVHRKDALTVKTGDKVIYTIRIYNEGEIDGWATQVTDHLPEGLKFVPPEQSEINKKYGWKLTETIDINTQKTISYLTTDYLADANYKLSAFNKETLALDYEDLQVECEVIATAGATSKSMKNVAEITSNKDINGNTVDIDRDSNPKSLTNDQINNYGDKGNYYQDDDDFEELKILPKEEKEEEFDLALRKFISNITNSDNKPNVMKTREPQVDTSPLLNGKTTATYNHTKQPVGVSNGDIVTYTIRVYNEGKINGYVTEITDHLPLQLEFIVDDELNAKYGWVVSSDGRTVKTDITSPKTMHTASRDTIYANRNTGSQTDKVLLKAFDGKEGSTLDYIDVQIKCRVKENIDLYEKITNIADITNFTNSEGLTVTDRDSQKANVTLPTDETLPAYKDTEIERGDKYIPGQQDDDDFEKLVLQRFDLALRKFITGVVSGDKTTDITNRVPVFKKESDTKYTYEHTKEPVEVANGNIVIYTLRVFNEGNMAGYATKVKDDIPEGLEFLPENKINTAFDWKMYQKDGTETKDVKKADYIETDFLSKDKEKQEGDNLINSFNPETMEMPNYKDLKIAFKVTEPDTSDRIIINKAQISEDSDENGKPIDDVDSIPNEWNEGEDDQDIEKIKVKYFDLSLKKWVTEAIVTVDGKTTIIKSGHTGNENPEPPMKVEIQAGKINKTTVKFKYSIKVTNEGEIEGYVKEVVDYIPQGLKFVAKDNPKWKIDKDGKVVTDQLKDKLLKPGESATVDIVLTWINGKNNMGTKVNWAEINKDDNPYDSPDIDSTPGNNKPGEDDIDDAPVLLAPATGSAKTYITLTLSCITILAGGIFLIKKFVI